MSARAFGALAVCAAVMLTACKGAAAQSAPGLRSTSGPYPVVMVEDPRLPGSTVYRPGQLPSGKLPVLIWGNGGCINAGNIYAILLTEIASHGYLVVAAGPIVKDFDRPPPGVDLRGSTPQQLVRAIDWAVAENARAGGPLAGKVDTDNVAAMGTSCGGQQALWAALNDVRVKTLILGNSGLGEGGGRLGVTVADLNRLKVPVLYLVGGPTDTAFQAVEDNFRRLTTIPVFKGALPVGHFETWHQDQGGAFGQAALAWLDWLLKDSLDAARAFTGPDCALCREPGWTVERKNIP